MKIIVEKFGSPFSLGLIRGGAFELPQFKSFVNHVETSKYFDDGYTLRITVHLSEEGYYYAHAENMEELKEILMEITTQGELHEQSTQS